ncbi:MAG: ABC transporter ATP-binding protein [Burkholderiales bacterium RIFCSPLOWO2_12_FULL_64_99]|nr:MAG: ABC transporter ATP-binding protein [Burkholderiales bacterium RIFCSPHIGHO2_12_FULL_63_20]OGB62199.1 MAG: ABC transporter ATP-binding protein [Burkholderiales bacterium RIFCSPLOWO2_12_FULL_64_99]
MFIFKLLLKNAFRHKLRTLLTMVGLVVAISAFGLLRTIVDAWYAGVEGTSSTRLITRSAISVGQPLPRYYAERIRKIEGVSGVTWANWFGGIYLDRRNFFARFAVDGPSYFAIYPEYQVSDAERIAFMADRQGAIIGRDLAQRFGWQVGDTIPLSGTIYPGNWSFTIRGIYASPDPNTDESIMLMHWSLLSENLRKRLGSTAAEQVALYVVGISDPSRASAISQDIDALFRNSTAETKTETEKSFQLGMVAMSQTVLMAIRAVSFVVVLIIMAVMANTMTMTARERLAEYATLKALGFSPAFVVKLLFGESLMIAVIGGAMGMALTFPLTAAFMQQTGTLFKVFEVSQTTLLYQALAALVVGLLAAAWPAWKMSRIDIVQGLRHVA